MPKKIHESASEGAFDNPDSSIEREKSHYVNDAWIARQICMQPTTIRGQRKDRRDGEPHWLTLDPVIFGDKPRYVRTEVEKWLLEMKGVSQDA